MPIEAAIIIVEANQHLPAGHIKRSDHIGGSGGRPPSSVKGVTMPAGERPAVVGEGPELACNGWPTETTSDLAAGEFSSASWTALACARPAGGE